MATLNQEPYFTVFKDQRQIKLETSAYNSKHEYIHDSTDIGIFERKETLCEDVKDFVRDKCQSSENQNGNLSMKEECLCDIDVKKELVTIDTPWHDEIIQNSYRFAIGETSHLMVTNMFGVGALASEKDNNFCGVVDNYTVLHKPLHRNLVEAGHVKHIKRRIKKENIGIKHNCEICAREFSNLTNL